MASEQKNINDDGDFITNFPFKMVIITIIALWILLAFGVYLLILFKDVGRVGQLGDSFGMVNSIISTLAFGTLWYSIRLQKEELSETRTEFAKQSKSLEEQSESMRSQSNLMALQNAQIIKQAFETTFFNLQASIKDIVNNLEYTANHRAMLAMIHFMDQYKHGIHRGPHRPQITTEQCRKIFLDQIDQTNGSFDHFVFSLNVAIEYVVNSTEYSSTLGVKRDFYLKIIGSTFTIKTLKFLKIYLGFGKYGVTYERNLQLFLKAVTFE